MPTTPPVPCSSVSLLPRPLDGTQNVGPHEAAHSVVEDPVPGDTSQQLSTLDIIWAGPDLAGTHMKLIAWAGRNQQQLRA